MDNNVQSIEAFLQERNRKSMIWPAINPDLN